jgi:hypothetical protein
VADGTALQSKVILVLGATATIPIVTVWRPTNLTSIIPVGAADTAEHVVKASVMSSILAVRHSIIIITIKIIIARKTKFLSYYL